GVGDNRPGRDWHARRRRIAGGVCGRDNPDIGPSVRYDRDPRARGALQPSALRRRNDPPDRMLNRHNRLLVAIYVLSDALLAVSAFIVAYAVRFHTGLPVPRGVPPFDQYV